MVEAKQYGERVNIVKYIRVEKKWRFAAVVEKQGRVIRDQVWIARRKEHHPEGAKNDGDESEHGDSGKLPLSCGQPARVAGVSIESQTNLSFLTTVGDKTKG